jgi:hypothetical protein
MKTFEEWFKEHMSGRAFGSDAGEYAVKEQMRFVWNEAQKNKK